MRPLQDRITAWALVLCCKSLCVKLGTDLVAPNCRVHDAIFPRGRVMIPCEVNEPVSAGQIGSIGKANLHPADREDI